MARNTQCSDAGDETMRLAIERFRTKMESSNRRFLQDRIDEIQAMGLATEEQKLEKMRLYWSDLGRGELPQFNDYASPGHVRQAREARTVTRLEDVKLVYNQHMDGIIPPTLVTDEWRQMFLEVVESVCNKAAAQAQDEEDKDFYIPRCHELGQFIKYANGVQDPDFRHSGICPFEPVFPIGVEGYAFPDRPAVLAQPPPDVSASWEILKEYLQEYILSEDFIDSTVDEDLEVKVGFQTGLGSHREYDTWYSTYLYCRQSKDCKSDDDSLNETLKDWAWRIVVIHADGENPAILYGRHPRFDSIPKFLDWYSSWLDYVDMDVVRKDVNATYGDDD
ncbi:hypothetical protein N7454_004947 [Penicillium verhagenii]|nr:hypothetical protein N7454_004947 [Penicillium verhagenii]